MNRRTPSGAPDYLNDTPTIEELRAKVEAEVPITKAMCYQERMRKRWLRKVLLDKLVKKYGLSG